MRSYHYQWTWQADSPPEALWPLLSNTDRQNSEGGLPVLQVTAAELGAQAGIQRAAFTTLGVRVEWAEGPSEWVYPSWFLIRRDYSRGPFRDVVTRVELAPEGAGTRVTYTVDIRSNGALGNVVIPVQIGTRLRRTIDRLFRHYFAIAGQRKVEFESPLLEPVTVDGARLDALTHQLESVVAGPGPQRLAQLLRTADDILGARLRPYALAPQLGLTRDEALTLFLQATRLGLLDLQWDLLCPRCRGAKETALALSDLNTRVHCDACRIDFSAGLPQQVELTFRPNPAVRRVELETFCIGGPQRTPHVFAQLVLAPGDLRSIELVLPEGSYRLRQFAPAQDNGALAEVDCTITTGAVKHATIVLTDTGWETASLTLGTRSELTLTNSTTAPQTILLEGTAWRTDALTAAEVSTKQAFRDLFSGELLRPGESISVGTLTVAFTDLRGSTALYRRIGDAPAFGRVLDHFAVIRAAVEAEGGAVIKTMGDAVLAVFTSPAAALRAMRAAQQALAHPEGAEPLGLKVGLHSGPCIAVTLNQRLDYFGTTMNLAARLTALSDGSDVLLTQTVLDDPEVQTALSGGSLTPVTAELKGLSDLPQLWRLAGA